MEALSTSHPDQKDGSFVKRKVDESKRYVTDGKNLIIRRVDNSDNSDDTKPWKIGLEYINEWGEDWRICAPRDFCLRPLHLKIIFQWVDTKGKIQKEQLYPSCIFHTSPNKFRIISEGVSYKTVLDISKWREVVEWLPEGGYNEIPRTDRGGVKKCGIFIFSLVYPHSLYPVTSNTLRLDGYLNCEN